MLGPALPTPGSNPMILFVTLVVDAGIPPAMMAGETPAPPRVPRLRFRDGRCGRPERSEGSRRGRSSFASLRTARAASRTPDTRAGMTEARFEIDQAVHIVSGGERAAPSLLVLEDAALAVVANAGVEHPRETAHDVHPFVAGAPQGRLRRSDKALKRPKIGILRAAATCEKDRLDCPRSRLIQCPAQTLWDMISPLGQGRRPALADSVRGDFNADSCH